MKISEALIQAKALITDPKNWTQGAYARDKEGAAGWSTDEGAVCFCSLGAVGRVTQFSYPQSDAACRYLEAAMGDPVIIFNDEHTHAEVMAAWDKAIEAAKRDEKGQMD